MLRTNVQETAEKLLKEVGAIDASVDLYSAIQVFFRMATGQTFSGSGDISPYSIQELTEDEDIVVEYLYKMMCKNDENQYCTVEMIEEDLEILKKLIQKEAHPLVLLQGVREAQGKYNGIEIEEDLLGNICEK